MWPREDVEAADDLFNHGVEEEDGKAAEREAMGTGAEPLLNCPD
jgi:hypothetical protein